MIAEAIKWCIN